jgi:hypothetical protein
VDITVGNAAFTAKHRCTIDRGAKYLIRDADVSINETQRQHNTVRSQISQLAQLHALSVFDFFCLAQGYEILNTNERNAGDIQEAEEGKNEDVCSEAVRRLDVLTWLVHVVDSVRGGANLL